MRLLSLSFAMALLACSPDQAAPDTKLPNAAKAEQRSLDGRYVVTFVNEASPVIGIEGHEPTVTITGECIHFQSQCIYDDWSFERDGERLKTAAWDYGGEPVAMCARGFAPGETAIMAAIGGADTVRFVQSGLWFSGPQGTVQLRRIPDPADIAQRAVDLTGSWRVAGLDGQAIDAPYAIALTADSQQIWWEPACAGQSVSYSVSGSRFRTISYDDGPTMVCDIGYPDELERVWSALAAADTIQRMPDNGVRISGNGRSVTLFSQ